MGRDAENLPSTTAAVAATSTAVATTASVATAAVYRDEGAKSAQASEGGKRHNPALAR